MQMEAIYGLGIRNTEVSIHSLKKSCFFFTVKHVGIVLNGHPHF